ncbi:LysR family transcriptional regulator [Achromobacter pestifer]|uniref:LysR family transcriptional regulator n=1 Tax=Achromobacter pestifer TaxID=1353889 RepID=A0A7D4E297_9BURK|nr:LysR substrate-binding domain-containing protein [Achromobacter pestifer]QKH38927.1 LysR family transcriptional regulator [Achromobacter pestifer]
MKDLNDLYYFVQVADHGGFAAAARVTGIQKSMLSRRMQQLEDRLGVRLINRSTRRFSITEVGREYYDRCVAMLVEAEAAEQVIAQVRAEPRGIIRVSCPVALINFQFGALFARFLTTYPDIELHLESSNRRVDVISEGFDVAIRVRFPPLESTELVMRWLDESTQCLVASPSFLAGRTLRSPTDLEGARSVTLGPARREHQWQLHHADGRTANVRHVPRLISDDMAALCNAAMAGVGVVSLPTMMVWPYVEAGQLIQILPEWRPRAGLVHAVFPSRRGLLPSVRTLIEFLAAECQEARKAGPG